MPTVCRIMLVIILRAGLLQPLSLTNVGLKVDISIPVPLPVQVVRIQLSIVVSDSHVSGIAVFRTSFLAGSHLTDLHPCRQWRQHQGQHRYNSGSCHKLLLYWPCSCLNGSAQATSLPLTKGLVIPNRACSSCSAMATISALTRLHCCVMPSCISRLLLALHPPIPNTASSSSLWILQAIRHHHSHKAQHSQRCRPCHARPQWPVASSSSPRQSPPERLQNGQRTAKYTDILPTEAHAYALLVPKFSICKFRSHYHPSLN